MNMHLYNQMLKKIEYNPKNLFLIDGFGAIISAFLLGVVLVRFENVFGIPSSTLYFLAIFPIIFSIYDFYYFQKENQKLYVSIKRIAILNLLYCCLSILTSLYHIKTITALGWTYILCEVLIILILVNMELKVSKKIKAQ